MCWWSVAKLLRLGRTCPTTSSTRPFGKDGPMPAPPDPADVLLSKARQDHHLAAHVANVASISNEHVGFFCQQAIEKSLKSVLSRRSIRYRRTHDLAELLDLLNDHQIAYPLELE